MIKTIYKNMLNYRQFHRQGFKYMEEMNKVVDIVKDLSTITTIPVRTLDKLISQSDWCICNAIEETILSGNDTVCVDIGIGLIYMSINNNEVQYKFVPSSKLEKYVVDTVVNAKNPLTINLESTFINRILKTYKDMF